MRERTITISGASKTFSVTGWRIGTIVAPAAATDAIRKVHDFLTVGAPAPLQEAVAIGLETLGPEYYRGLAADYRARRDLLCGALGAAGFRCTPPQAGERRWGQAVVLRQGRGAVAARPPGRASGRAARAKTAGGAPPWDRCGAPSAPGRRSRRAARRAPTRRTPRTARHRAAARARGDGAQPRPPPRRGRRS